MSYQDFITQKVLYVQRAVQVADALRRHSAGKPVVNFRATGVSVSYQHADGDVVEEIEFPVEVLTFSDDHVTRFVADKERERKAAVMDAIRRQVAHDLKSRRELYEKLKKEFES